MASIYDKASLVLIPSGTKTSKVYSQVPTNGDGDFTFSRSTAATRVNASGNIEKQTGNLFVQSNTFDTTWALQNSTISGGQSGYDGTSDAWLLERLSTGAASLYQMGSVSGIYTASIYAKAGTADAIRFRVDQTTDANLYVDLTDGSIITSGGIIDSNVESIGGGWYRISMAFNAVGYVNTQVRIVDGGGAAFAGNIYIQDAQLEQGLVARDYIETTTTAIYGGITDNVPRLDYTDSSCPALLLEPQRTNEIPNSEYFAGYNLNDCSVTSNGATSPEGVDNATKLFDGTGSGGHYISGMGNAYFSNTEIRNTSVFAKAGTLDHIQIRLVNRTGSFSYYLVDVDLTDGSVIHTASGNTTNTSNEVEDYGNGWYRITLKCSFTDTNVLSSGMQIFTHNGTTHSYVGTGTDYVLIYGAQHEAGSYATSYIPTYGSAVTRNVDVGYNSSAASVIGQGEGTIYIETIPLDDTTSYTERLMQFESSGSDFMTFQRYAGGNITFYGTDGTNTWTIQALNVFNGGATTKIAGAYKVNDVALYVNGESKGTDTTIPTMPNCDRVWFANNSGGSLLYIGKHTKVMFFPTRLSNEELATLTTI